MIHEDPPVYVIDTPGVMVPDLDNVDIAMRLALCGVWRAVILKGATSSLVAHPGNYHP